MKFMRSLLLLTCFEVARGQYANLLPGQANPDTIIGTTQTASGFYNPAGPNATLSKSANASNQQILCSSWLSRDSAHGGCYLPGDYHNGQDLIVGLGSAVTAISDGQIVAISRGYGRQGGTAISSPLTTYAQASVNQYSWGVTRCTDISDHVGADPNCGSSDARSNVAVLVKHKLQNGTEFLALYGHVLDYNPRTRQPFTNSGDDSYVHAGDALGLVGDWYNTPHLHFGVLPTTTYPRTGWGILLDSDSNGGSGYVFPDGNLFVDPVAWLTNPANLPDNYLDRQGANTGSARSTATPISANVLAGKGDVVPINYLIKSENGFIGPVYPIQDYLGLIGPIGTGSSTLPSLLSTGPGIQILSSGEQRQVKGFVYVKRLQPLGNVQFRTLDYFSSPTSTGVSPAINLGLTVLEKTGLTPAGSLFSADLPSFPSGWTRNYSNGTYSIAGGTGLVFSGSPGSGVYYTSNQTFGDKTRVSIRYTDNSPVGADSRIWMGFAPSGSVTGSMYWNFIRDTGNPLWLGYGLNQYQTFNGAAPLGIQHQLAIERDSGSIRYFLDGALLDTKSLTAGNLSAYLGFEDRGGSTPSSITVNEIKVEDLTVAGQYGTPTIDSFGVVGAPAALTPISLYTVASNIDPVNVQGNIYGPGCVSGCPGTKIDATLRSVVMKFTPPQTGTFQYRLRNGQFGTESASANLTVNAAAQANCSVSASQVAQNQALTFSSSLASGVPPFSTSWEGAFTGSGNSKTISFRNGGVRADVAYMVTDSTGSQSGGLCGTNVVLGTPVISTSGFFGSVQNGVAFTGFITGFNFDPATLDVWFCRDSNRLDCYQHPNAGRTVTADVDSASAQLTGINLGAGLWRIKVRNGASGVWSNFSDSFNVQGGAGPFTGAAFGMQFNSIGSPAPATVQVDGSVQAVLSVGQSGFWGTSAILSDKQRIKGTLRTTCPSGSRCLGWLGAAPVGSNSGTYYWDPDGTTAWSMLGSYQSFANAVPQDGTPVNYALERDGSTVRFLINGTVLRTVTTYSQTQNLAVYFGYELRSGSGTATMNFSGLAVESLVQPSAPTLTSVDGSLLRPSQLTQVSAVGTGFDPATVSLQFRGTSTCLNFSCETQLGDRVGTPTATNITTKANVPAGVYDVRVKNGDGQVSATTVLVAVQNPPLSASCAASPSSVTLGGSVSINASASGGSGSGYQFSYNGGAFTTSLTSSVTPASLGTYTATVQAKDSTGTTVSTTCTAQVQPPPVSASCSISPNPVPYNQSATIYGSASGGTGTGYQYSFNGNPFSVASSVGILPNPGTYNATLQVKDSAGNTASTSCTAQVQSPPPLGASCSITPATSLVGDGVTVNAFASGGTGSGYIYSINGGPFLSTSTQGGILPDVGTYTANVQVKDSSGTASSSSCSGQVNGAAPVVQNATWVGSMRSQVNFSGTITGLRFVSSATVWFCNSTTCYQQPLAGVFVNNLFSISVQNVALGAGSWQAEVRTPYGSSRSASFVITP